MWSDIIGHGIDCVRTCDKGWSCDHVSYKIYLIYPHDAQNVHNTCSQMIMRQICSECTQYMLTDDNETNMLRMYTVYAHIWKWEK